MSEEVAKDAEHARDAGTEMTESEGVVEGNGVERGDADVWAPPADNTGALADTARPGPAPLPHLGSQGYIPADHGPQATPISGPPSPPSRAAGPLAIGSQPLAPWQPAQGQPAQGQPAQGQGAQGQGAQGHDLVQPGYPPQPQGYWPPGYVAPGHAPPYPYAQPPYGATTAPPGLPYAVAELSPRAPGALAGRPKDSGEKRSLAKLWIWLALVVVVAAASGFGSWDLSRSHVITAGQALKSFDKVIAKARQTSGYHYSSTDTQAGAAQNFIGRAGQSGGTQDITQGQQQFQLILTSNDIVFFNGNTAALTAQVGFSSDLATAWAGKWISFTQQDSLGPQFAAAITVASNLDEYVSGVSPSVETTVRVGDKQLTQYREANASFIMDVDPKTDLPVQVILQIPAGGSTPASTVTQSFSDWGASVRTSAPAGGTAFDSIPQSGNTGTGSPTNTGGAS